MKECPKCKGFTYSDNANKCVDCNTKLVEIKPEEVLGINYKGYKENQNE